VGIASKSFELIKSGFQAGRDLEQMSGDLSRWMGASSDIDQAEKQAKNPGVFSKVFGAGSIEATALQAYAAKKKLEEQRYELKIFLNLTQGPGAYDELLQMEGQIRKQRQETIYKQQQLRKQIGEGIAWLFLVLIIGGFLLLLVSIFKKSYSKDYTRQQKINNGTIILPTMTLCRLKTQKVYKGKMACIYVGAQKTYEMEFTDVRIGCPKQYRCVVNKNSSIPSIDDVMKSLRDIAK
jgi:hypothetical protein|tara:strand:- start:1834 stop:2544 length:711 start_codon:yes stop_codon:yes gene_type:complete